jgi:DNA-directed RNA polymerase specialized sigma subunit
MYESLQKLGENCQRILRLFYFEKKSMEVIAQEMEYTNAENAKNQKYKCLQQLKKYFNESNA